MGAASSMPTNERQPFHHIQHWSFQLLPVVTLVLRRDRAVVGHEDDDSMIETVVIVTLFCDATEQVLDMRTMRA